MKYLLFLRTTLLVKQFQCLRILPIIIVTLHKRFSSYQNLFEYELDYFRPAASYVIKLPLSLKNAAELAGFWNEQRQRQEADLIGLTMREKQYKGYPVLGDLKWN